jgi:PAS domain S-box-containing protein
MNENKRIKRKILLGFIAAFIILIFIGTLSYKSLHDLNEINRQVQSNLITTGKIEDVVTAVQRTTAAQSGYVLLGEERFLESYIQSKENVGAEINTLNEIMKDDETKLKKLAELENLIDERIGISEKAMFIYGVYGRDSVINFLRDAKGAQIMLNIIATSQTLKDEEKYLITQKSFLEREKSEYTRLAIILGSLLALSFIFIATIIIFRDINKRAKIEAELIHQEKLFKTVVYNFPDGAISIFDNDLKYLVSDGIELRELGFTGEYTKGKFVKDFVPEELFQVLEPFYHDALNGNKNSIEFNFNGKAYYSIFLPLTINNKIEGGIIITQNITKRKKAEEELRKSESLYRTIAENFPNGSITVYNREMKIVKVDGLILKEFGFKKEDIEGKFIKELLPDEIYEKIHEQFYGIFEDRSSVFDISFRGKYFLVITVPMHNEKGEIVNGMAISQDISTIKESEEKIIKSRDFHLTLFEEFPAMIWRSGMDAKANYFNKTWLDFTGKSLEQEIADGWTDDFHPDDIDRRFKTYLSAFKNKEPFSIDYRMRSYDGEYRWVTEHGRPYYDLDGKFAGYIGSCYDITQNKLAEEKQEKSRQLTTLLQDIAISANESEDIDKLIKFTINRVCEFMKWTIGHFFWNITSENELVSSGICCDNISEKYEEFKKLSGKLTIKENEGVVGKALAGKKYVWTYDIRDDKEFIRVKKIKDLDLKTGFSFPIKVKDEVVSVMEFYDNHFHTEDKELIKIMDTISAQLGRAIERKWSQDNLQKSEEALETAQKIAHIGSWEWNIPDNLLSWSDELYSIYGLDPDKEKITFEKFTSMLHADDIDKVLKIIEDSRKNKNPFEFDYRIIRPDGSEKILHAQGEVILDDEGNVISLVGIGQDITAKKIAEENLLNTNRKLQEAQNELIHNEKLAALGRIASNMAHEIRNPLANISASSQLLLSKYKEDKSLKSYLDIINRNTDTANRIIRELLDFASPREIKLKKGYLNEVIDYVSTLVEPRCLQNNIELSIDNRLGGNFEILLNEKKLEEALLNFISNSIDAMPGGGKLTIILKYDQYNEELVLCIDDTGYGIPQENIGKVFEPFFTTKDSGTGLGMGLSHQIIKSHHGKLNISSEVGEGTSIEIKFPIINKSNDNGEAGDS